MAGVKVVAGVTLVPVALVALNFLEFRIKEYFNFPKILIKHIDARTFCVSLDKELQFSFLLKFLPRFNLAHETALLPQTYQKKKKEIKDKNKNKNPESSVKVKKLNYISRRSSRSIR